MKLLKNGLLNGYLGQLAEGVSTIKCKNGAEYTADHVIFTGSLNYLKSEKDSLFTPHLPDRKINAMNSIGMGLVDKVFLEFPSLDFLGGADEINICPQLKEVTDNDTRIDGGWTNKVVKFYIERGNILACEYTIENTVAKVIKV